MGGPCPGFEPKSECFRVLGLFHEVRLDGGLIQKAKFKGGFLGHTAAENMCLHCSIYEFHVLLTIPWNSPFRLESLIY